MKCRGFTLVEVVLASVLGSLVVLTTIGLFSLVTRQQDAGSARFEEALHVQRAHETITRSMQLLLMSDQARPITPAAGTTGGTEEETEADTRTGDRTSGAGADTAESRGRRTGRERREARERDRSAAENRSSARDRSRDRENPDDPATTTDRAADAETTETTDDDTLAADLLTEVPPASRFLLEIDEEAPALMRRRTPDGGIVAIAPQRFEVALRAAPIFVPGYDQVRDAAVRARREDPRHRRRQESGEEIPPEVPVGVAPGVRGVFELSWEPDPIPPGQTLLVEPFSDEDGSWTLWWRPIWPSATPDVQVFLDAARLGTLTEEDLLSAGRIRLIPNLRYLRWSAFKTTTSADGQTRLQALDELEVAWTEDLPAYVTIEFETREGLWNNWMFEVAWSTGPEPGEVILPAVTPSATRDEAGRAGTDRGETATDRPANRPETGRAGSRRSIGGRNSPSERRGGNATPPVSRPRNQRSNTNQGGGR